MSFHADRLTGIGASDAAAVLGVSKWQTPLGVYLEKRGEGDPIAETPAMTWGKILEPVVLRAFAERTGRLVQTGLPMMRDKEHTFMLTHLDGAVEGAVVEAKTARTAEGWGEDGSDQAPGEYLCQVHHQMIVADLRLAYIPVLIAGSDFRVIEVPFDAEFGDMIIDAERDMWRRIKEGDPPLARTLADVNTLYRNSNARAIEANAEILDAWRALIETRHDIARCEGDVERFELQLKMALGDADTLTYKGRTLATWKEQKQQRMDSKALKAALPDVWEAYSTESKFRKFLPKECDEWLKPK